MRKDNAVIETPNEETLRKRLLRRLQRLFRDGGYDLYYQEFKNYKLDVDEDYPAPGAIDSENKVIHIRKDVLENASDDEISLLLRHELLHSLLKHVVRSVKFYARELGLNPSSITKKDMRIIRKRMSEPLASWDTVSAPVAFNIAGDEHLSNYYDQIDKNLTKDPQSMLFGGLIIDDHPEWVGKSFEHIMRSLIEEENILQHRLAKKVYGHYVDEDTFEVEREEESEFVTSDSISQQDIIGVDLWDTDTFTRDAKNNPEALHNLGYLSSFNECWVQYDEEETPSYKQAPYGDLKTNKIKYTNTKTTNKRLSSVFLPIFPIIKVRYLTHYQQLKENGIINCLGLSCIPLDARRLISINPIAVTNLCNVNYCKDFHGSNADKEFQRWKAEVLK